MKAPLFFAGVGVLWPDAPVIYLHDVLGGDTFHISIGHQKVADAFLVRSRMLWVLVPVFGITVILVDVRYVQYGSYRTACRIA